MAGRHRVRRELYVNTIAAWLWSQGTLVVSVLTLPLLTRLLSTPELGLWTLLVSLSALASVADMGMSLVFLRRMTEHDGAGRASVLRGASAFYRLATAVLVAVLALACLLPGGLLGPYLADTRWPELAALAVIAAIGVNLRCQTCALRLLALGRMDLERIFGAGPAVAGTLACVAAAYWYRTAVAVALAYAAVEIAFDLALVIVARRRWPGEPQRARPAGAPAFAWWARAWYESTGVVLADALPLLSVTIGMAVAGHAAGPAGAALYGVASKVGSLARRVTTPFTDSMFVSLCRATRQARPVLCGLAAQLAIVAVACGAALAFAVVTAGAQGVRLAFGAGYGRGAWAVLVIVLAETVRSAYRPFVRLLQAENGVGALRLWFAGSLAAQAALSVPAAGRWGAAGAAGALLACTVIFEAAPAVTRLRWLRPPARARGRPVLRPAVAWGGTACAALLLAWGRQRLGGVAVGCAAVAAGAAGALALRQIARYLAAARPVAIAPLARDGGQAA